MQLGILELVLYSDLVYTFRRIVRKPNFRDQFKKIIKRFKRVGHSMDIRRPSANLVVYPIMVSGYGFLFICTVVGQASDSITTITLSFHPLDGAWCLHLTGHTIAQLEVFFSYGFL